MLVSGFVKPQRRARITSYPACSPRPIVATVVGMSRERSEPERAEQHLRARLRGTRTKRSYHLDGPFRVFFGRDEPTSGPSSERGNTCPLPLVASRFGGLLGSHWLLATGQLSDPPPQDAKTRFREHGAAPTQGSASVGAFPYNEWFNADNVSTTEAGVDTPQHRNHLEPTAATLLSD